MKSNPLSLPFSSAKGLVDISQAVLYKKYGILWMKMNYTLLAFFWIVLLPTNGPQGHKSTCVGHYAFGWLTNRVLKKIRFPPIIDHTLLDFNEKNWFSSQVKSNPLSLPFSSEKGLVDILQAVLYKKYSILEWKWTIPYSPFLNCFASDKWSVGAQKYLCWLLCL